jgi:hypothetical protein
MPFGKSMGLGQLKQMAVRLTDLGGGQTRVESDYSGEVTGEAAGNHYGTYTVIVNENDDPGRPMPYTYVAATLLPSGATMSVTGSGMVARTGKGHNFRFRGLMRSSPSKDPKLAELNNMIVAVELEFDPATNTLKGEGCEWK